MPGWWRVAGLLTVPVAVAFVAAHSYPLSCSFKFRAPPVMSLNGSPAHTPKVYHVTELEQRAKMGSEALERNNDSGRGRHHLAMQPGSMVGTDQYLMRKPNVRTRTVLVSKLRYSFR
jgi:hypothetical protein